jgi:hypothetical protein
LSWTPSVAIPLGSMPLIGELLSPGLGAISLTSHLTVEYEDTTPCAAGLSAWSART